MSVEKLQFGDDSAFEISHVKCTNSVLSLLGALAETGRISRPFERSGPLSKFGMMYAKTVALPDKLSTFQTDTCTLCHLGG